MDQCLELICLKRISEDDQRSFDNLFMHYQPKLIHFINGFIKDQEEGRDMVQDIFFKIWTNRATLTRVNSFKSYLFQMARYAIYDYYDHSLVKQKYESKQMELSGLEESIESNLYAKELELWLDLAIENLPEQRKLIYRLSRTEGLSNDEIAQRLNLNKRTVENQISLALATLRKITTLVNLFFF
jgi:RNA polymerase sigma-70 factor (ECF subfamily)